MSLPFTNLIFCSTSLNPSIKKGLLTKIKALGGSHVTDLTSDVQVLVVGERFTNKYVYCVNKRPDIKFMSPKTVADAYEYWLNMEEHDTFNFDDFQMPIFEGLDICLARFNNDQHIRSDQTAQIIKLIRKNGGKAEVSLHESCDCLITNEKSGKRYEKSKEWKIKAIHPLWVLHSIERGAIFPWNSYDIDKVQDEAKIGEQSLPMIKEILILKDITLNQVPLIDANSRSMLITAPKKKSRLWDSIMEEADDANNGKKKKVNEWDENLDGDDDITAQISVNTTSMDKYSRIIEQHMKSKPASNLQLQQKPQLQRQETTTSPISTLFEGLTFKIQYFETKKSHILTKVIKSYSGELTTSETPAYLIIPHDFPIDDLPQTTRRLILSDDPSTRVVTEWFIERSLHYNQLKYDTWTKPFYKEISMIKPSKLHVVISGFGGVELLHTKKLIALLPSYFELSEYLNEFKDLLIVNSDILQFKNPSPPSTDWKYPDLNQHVSKPEVQLASATSIRKKVKYAKEKNIPLVRVSFIFDFFKNEENRIPVINGKEWCLFVPRGENIKEGLKDYIDISYHKPQDQNKNQDKEDPKPNSIRPKLNTNIGTPRLTPSGSSLIPRLTSPLRNKSNHDSNNGGRLLGRAEISHFDTIRSNNSTNSDLTGKITGINDENGDDADEDELNGTQIKYEDNLIQSKEKQTRFNTTRRSTRSVSKEMMNIMD